MQEILNKYFDFIISQLEYDAQIINEYFGWGFLIVPAIIFFMLMMLKYIILLSPIIFPLNFAISFLKTLINGFRNKKEDG